MNNVGDQLAKMSAHVIAGSIGFQRVAVLAIGLVRKGQSLIGDSSFLKYFSTFLALSVRITLFRRTARTDR